MRLVVVFGRFVGGVDVVVFLFFFFGQFYSYIQGYLYCFGDFFNGCDWNVDVMGFVCVFQGSMWFSSYVQLVRFIRCVDYQVDIDFSLFIQ